MADGLFLRRAVVPDVKAVHALLLKTAGEGLLLPRPLGDLYNRLREFVVLSDDAGHVYGCCALSIVWDNIAEIRSLVVSGELRGQHWGYELVSTCLNEARSLGLRKVFTLTYQIDFFKKLEFTIVPKEVLPNKIWADCIHCPKFPDCDETAMLLEL